MDKNNKLSNLWGPITNNTNKAARSAWKGKIISLIEKNNENHLLFWNAEIQKTIAGLVDAYHSHQLFVVDFLSVAKKELDKLASNKDTTNNDEIKAKYSALAQLVIRTEIGQTYVDFTDTKLKEKLEKIAAQNEEAKQEIEAEGLINYLLEAFDEDQYNKENKQAEQLTQQVGKKGQELLGALVKDENTTLEVDKSTDPTKQGSIKQQNSSESETDTTNKEDQQQSEPKDPLSSVIGDYIRANLNKREWNSPMIFSKSDTANSPFPFDLTKNILSPGIQQKLGNDQQKKQPTLVTQSEKQPVAAKPKKPPVVSQDEPLKQLKGSSSTPSLDKFLENSDDSLLEKLQNANSEQQEIEPDLDQKQAIPASQQTKQTTEKILQESPKDVNTKGDQEKSKPTEETIIAPKQLAAAAAKSAAPSLGLAAPQEKPKDDDAEQASHSTDLLPVQGQSPDIAGYLNPSRETVAKQVKLTKNELLDMFTASAAMINSEAYHRQNAESLAREGFDENKRPLDPATGRDWYNGENADGKRNFFGKQINYFRHYFESHHRRQKFIDGYMERAQKVHNMSAQTQAELQARASYAQKYANSGIAGSTNYQKVATFQHDAINDIAEKFRTNKDETAAVSAVNALMASAQGDAIRQRYAQAGMSEKDLQYIGSNIIEQIKQQAGSVTAMIDFVTDVKAITSVDGLQARVNSFHKEHGFYPGFLLKFCINPTKITQTEFSLIKSNTVLQEMTSVNMTMRVRINAYYQKQGAQIGSAELDEKLDTWTYRLGKKIDSLPWGVRFGGRAALTSAVASGVFLAGIPAAALVVGGATSLALQYLKTNYESKAEGLHNVRMHLDDPKKLQRIKNELQKKLDDASWMSKNLWFGRAARWKKQMNLIDGVVNLEKDKQGNPYVFPIEKRIADLNRPIQPDTKQTQITQQKALVLDSLARMDLAGQTNRSYFSSQGGNAIAKNDQLLALVQSKAVELFPPVGVPPHDQLSWRRYLDNQLRNQKAYTTAMDAYTQVHDNTISQTQKNVRKNIGSDLTKKALVMGAMGTVTYYASDHIADMMGGISTSTSFDAPETLVKPGFENQWNLGDHTDSSLVQRNFSTAWDTSLNTNLNTITDGSKIDVTFGAGVDGVPASLTKYSDALVQAKQQALTQYVKDNFTYGDTYTNFLEAFDNNGINELKQFVVNKGVTDGNTNLFAMRALEGVEKMLQELVENGKTDVDVSFNFEKSLSVAGGPPYQQDDRMFTGSIEVAKKLTDTTEGADGGPTPFFASGLHNTVGASDPQVASIVNSNNKTTKKSSNNNGDIADTTNQAGNASSDSGDSMSDGSPDPFPGFVGNKGHKKPKNNNGEEDSDKADDTTKEDSSDAKADAKTDTQNDANAKNNDTTDNNSNASEKEKVSTAELLQTLDKSFAIMQKHTADLYTMRKREYMIRANPKNTHIHGIDGKLLTLAEFQEKKKQMKNAKEHQEAVYKVAYQQLVARGEKIPKKYQNYQLTIGYDKKKRELYTTIEGFIDRLIGDQNIGKIRTQKNSAATLLSYHNAMKELLEQADTYKMQKKPIREYLYQELQDMTKNIKVKESKIKRGLKSFGGAYRHLSKYNNVIQQGLNKKGLDPSIFQRWKAKSFNKKDFDEIRKIIRFSKKTNTHLDRSTGDAEKNKQATKDFINSIEAKNTIMNYLNKNPKK